MRKALAVSASDRHNDEQHEYRSESASHRGVYRLRLDRSEV
jgi:hypothetical protein